jgi:AraC-like DNA-binding protein
MPTIAELSPAAVLMDVCDRAGEPTVSLMRRVRLGYPRIPVIAYCGLTYADVRAAIAVSRAGVDDLVIRGYDSVRVVLQQVLQTDARRHVVAVVLAALAPAAADPVRALLAFGLTHAHARPSVRQAAAAAGVSVATLARTLRRAGFPTARCLLSWCRLLVAADRLESPGHPVSGIAEELGFGDASELRMMLMRHTGLRPSEVRQRGGLAFLAATFRARLAAAGGGGRGHVIVSCSAR